MQNTEQARFDASKLVENTTWFHGTHGIVVLQSILEQGILNGRKVLPNSLARDACTAISYGSGKDGVLIISQMKNEHLVKVGAAQKPRSTYSVDGKVPPENIKFHLPTETLLPVVDDLLTSIRVHYSDGVDFAGEYIERVAEVFLLYAKKVDGTTLNKSEALQYACDMIWNQIEITFQEDLNKMMSIFRSLLKESDENTIQLSTSVLRELKGKIGSSVSNWNPKLISWRTLLEDSERAQKLWLIIYHLEQAYTFWPALAEVNLAYEELSNAYQNEIEEMKKLADIVFGMTEELEFQ